LSFGPNQGPTLNGEASLAGNYSIGLRFSYSDFNTWRKIIDFKDRTSDRGQYFYGYSLSFLQFYPFVTGPNSVDANATVEVVFTRDGVSGLYTMDGLPLEC